MSSVMNLYGKYDLTPVRGEGCCLFDEAGRRYLDFTSGIAVNSLGHAPAVLVDALTKQAQTLWHCSNLFTVTGQEELADKLVAHTFGDKVFFCNSGAEAVEACIKISRRYQYERGHTNRYRLITAKQAFHGRTLATLAAGGQEKHMKGFAPHMDGVDQVPYNDLAAVEDAIQTDTAAILVEPVQGEGGFRVADTDYLQGLRKLADSFGLLLMFDEVQSGAGRTGRLFAHEHSGVTPDVMAVAKGIGGGFPVGACIATEKVASAMEPGSHGTTFGGNPLAMAVANAVMDALMAPGFMDEVAAKGILLQKHLDTLVARYPQVFKERRGLGLMQGVQTVLPNTDVIRHALEEKLILVPAGDNIVRCLPPLIVSEGELDEAFSILDRVGKKLTDVL